MHQYAYPILPNGDLSLNQRNHRITPESRTCQFSEFIRTNEQNRRNLFKRLINEYNNAITRTYDSFTTSIHSAHTLQTTTQHRNVNDKTKWSKHSKTYDSPLNTTKFETKRHGIGRSEATLRNQLSINDYSYTLPKITTPPTIPLSPDIFVKQTKNQLSLVARLGDWRVWERG